MVDDVVVIDVVVVVMVAVDAIDDNVRFGKYYWVDFYHQS